jgi:hypothetical protein
MILWWTMKRMVRESLQTMTINVNGFMQCKMPHGLMEMAYMRRDGALMGFLQIFIDASNSYQLPQI